MSEPQESDSDRYECWSCGGEGKKERPGDRVTDCVACAGSGQITEAKIRQMWRDWRADEPPEAGRVLTDGGVDQPGKERSEDGVEDVADQIEESLCSRLHDADRETIVFKGSRLAEEIGIPVSAVPNAIGTLRDREGARVEIERWQSEQNGRPWEARLADQEQLVTDGGSDRYQMPDGRPKATGADLYEHHVRIRVDDTPAPNGRVVIHVEHPDQNRGVRNFWRPRTGFDIARSIRSHIRSEIDADLATVEVIDEAGVGLDPDDLLPERTGFGSPARDDIDLEVVEA